MRILACKPYEFFLFINFINVTYFFFIHLVMGTPINAIVCAGFAHIRFAEYTQNFRTLPGTSILYVYQ